MDRRLCKHYIVSGYFFVICRDTDIIVRRLQVHSRSFSVLIILIIFHLGVILFVRCLLLFFFASLYHCTALQCHTFCRPSMVGRNSFVAGQQARDISVHISQRWTHTNISHLLAANKGISSLYQCPKNVWHRNAVQW